MTTCNEGHRLHTDSCWGTGSGPSWRRGQLFWAPTNEEFTWGSGAAIPGGMYYVDKGPAMWKDVACRGVAEQRQLGGVIGNEAGKAVSRASSAWLPSLDFKGLGTSRTSRAGQGQDGAYFRKMIRTVVWSVNRKGRAWMSGSRAEHALCGFKSPQWPPTSLQAGLCPL